MVKKKTKESIYITLGILLVLGIIGTIFYFNVLQTSLPSSGAINYRETQILKDTPESTLFKVTAKIDSPKIEPGNGRVGERSWSSETGTTNPRNGKGVIALPDGIITNTEFPIKSIELKGLKSKGGIGTCCLHDIILTTKQQNSKCKIIEITDDRILRDSGLSPGIQGADMNCLASMVFEGTGLKGEEAEWDAWNVNTIIIEAEILKQGIECTDTQMGLCSESQVCISNKCSDTLTFVYRPENDCSVMQVLSTEKTTDDFNSLLDCKANVTAQQLLIVEENITIEENITEKCPIFDAPICDAGFHLENYTISEGCDTLRCFPDLIEEGCIIFGTEEKRNNCCVEEGYKFFDEELGQCSNETKINIFNIIIGILAVILIIIIIAFIIIKKK
jgi:hypothetical protein